MSDRLTRIFSSVIDTRIGTEIDLWRDRFLCDDNIYIKYLHLIEKKTPFIKLCIQDEMESNKIISVIHHGFVFDDEDKKLSLDQKKYQLLAIMCKERNTV